MEAAELALDLVVVGLPVGLRGGDRDEEVVRSGAGRGRGLAVMLGRLGRFGRPPLLSPLFF